MSQAAPIKSAQKQHSLDAQKTVSKNVPKLRFPGFKGEWKTRKLGDLATKVGSGSTPRGGSAVYKTSGVPFIRSQNVTNGRLEMSDVVFIDRKIHESMLNSRLQPDDVLLNITGASLGRTCVVPSDFKEGNVNQHVCIIRLNETANPFLVHTILSQPRSLHELLKTQTGGGKEGLNFQAVRSFKVTLPDFDEQQKIAGFLTAVDDRVAVIDKRLQLLKKYKKGAMQKIFTQKIRFKDKNGKDYPAWEEKKISEIAYKENSTVSANEIEGKTGKYKVFGASGFVQKLDRYDQEDEYIAVVKDGAGVGRLGLYEPKSSVLGTLNVVKPKQGIVTRYLYALMSTIDFAKYSIGSTIPHVYFKDYAKEKFAVAAEPEQQKIADFLTAIDEKIKLEEAKLTQTKKFKKSLLQRMFV